MIRPGLCSVTLRRLDVDEVARRAALAGLTVLEWGADVHVRPGDERAADRALDAMARHGLTCGSYGSYFRATPAETGQFTRIAAGAVRLGAARVRVWAGKAGSAAVAPDERRHVVTALREAADIAAGHGLDVALEFHGGTLTDTAASTARLLDEVGRANLGTYWQPPQDLPDEQALAGLSRLLEHVRAVHVFSWWPGNERQPLTARTALWAQVFALLAPLARPVDALLEFVPGNDPETLTTEAQSLRQLLAAVLPASP
ncbi:sugar phosphate isomerase/epimerase family protein [Amycolatopsis sp. H20-H5]|uniref:sugar phosphate isomerase/epimerase family protein n=1 Tax=Amycolatopsis sp. H20-H5 TaxID=3046309 RepID=UPI002DBECB95|nr:TIM barrel protein [Amycolatopsis sp. H20-H5]MEC3977553.1 TIM barrel protein [Amycolatopsis sp. H20-H5]